LRRSSSCIPFCRLTLAFGEIRIGLDLAPVPDPGAHLCRAEPLNAVDNVEQVLLAEQFSVHRDGGERPGRQLTIGVTRIDRDGWSC
jgi:hypothetical protein